MQAYLTHWKCLDILALISEAYFQQGVLWILLPKKKKKKAPSLSLAYSDLYVVLSILTWRHRPRW